MLNELKRQLTNHGIIRQEYLIDFQLKYGGRAEMNGLNCMNWGLIHKRPKYLEPMTINVEGRHHCHFIQCVDTYPTDAMFIDENGRIYNGSKKAVFDSAQNLFLLGGLLQGYMIDFDTYSTAKQSWSEIQTTVSRMWEYPDTLTALYRWGDKIIRAHQGSIIAAYEKREMLAAEWSAEPRSHQPWWQFW